MLKNYKKYFISLFILKKITLVMNYVNYMSYVNYMNHVNYI